MKTSYFSSLLPELSTRAARSTIGVLGFSNAPLRRHLLDVFAQDYGKPGCFIGDPVFEATFGWKTAEETMSDLSGKLLHPEVVKAMDKPWGEAAKDYEFLKTSHPYTHQLTAWKALLSPGHQSVVVTSGTGSGKTECFMVPVLSSIAKNRQSSPNVGGVQAIFLYPLNALIQSQRERLRAWTGPFNEGIKFCLYNGMTPEEAKADKVREAPNEIHDRLTLRASPPDILVTNPTMLEYMLVRAQDAPILDKSQGKLQWIVLDEAHNYVGSQAAELALLLRRVLHAFGTDAEKVHFIATSATIGSGDDSTKGQLQDFLARLAGVSSERVTVVQGERKIPEVMAVIDSRAAIQTREDLQASGEEGEGLYKRLAIHPVARKIRSLFVPVSPESQKNFQSLSALKAALQVNSGSVTDDDALRWMDLLTSAYTGKGRTSVPFLPLRLHIFHNTMNGMWACADPQCSAKKGTHLNDPEWMFGMVYMDDRRKCGCGSPVFPLVSCNDCNETYLQADILSSGIAQKILVPLTNDVDEFTLDRDPHEQSEETDLEADREEYLPPPGFRSSVLIVNGQSRCARVLVSLDTDEIVRDVTDRTLALLIQDLAQEGGRWVLKCPACEGCAPLAEQFRKPLLGAPFQLGNIIPTLLEFCPDGENPLNLPRRGRRMITFTDSRQGTARIAAKLQQDAERNALRASVYRRLVSETAASGGERTKIQSDIEQFRKLIPIEDSPLRQLLLAQIQEKEDILSNMSSGKAVPHEEMVAWLAAQSPDISRWIYSSYVDSDASFSASKGKELVARILLCREFARRPKRQNSLETLGLVSVQYPKLSLITLRHPAVEAAGFSIQEWRDFLKIALDFYVRQYWAIQLPASWQRWGGQKIYPKQILPSKSLERSTSKLVKWPKVLPGAAQNRLVRLLAYVLKVDPHTDYGRERIDSLLLVAWDDLTINCGLLQLGGGQGRYLDLADIAFQNITKAWICPVTRRVMDVTLRGVTPYLPIKQMHDALVQCRPIQIPVCDVIAQDYPNDDARVEAARKWVESHPVLKNARIEGVWSNLNERIIEGAGYFRAVEHSAQQTGSRLEQYESQFKRGLINLMSCSTTMEMGVDIGGINTVAMNNVPPHPANYLQRAGRAGRRGETRSIALTVCKNNPHDQHVFRHTSWPFTTRLRTPGISLSSPLLVQRHINSMLLAKFLRSQSKDGKLIKLTLDWWMLPRGESRQERFAAWCECYDPSKHLDVQAGVSSLIRRTVFEGYRIASLVAEAGKTVASHAQQWLVELDAINVQMDQLVKRNEADRVPMRALEVQLTRLKGEYLLREMATSGVLPGYGFPTDITTFETLNKDSKEIQQNRDKGHAGREDNKFQRRELPSRDTVTALREYAPGASVVIDGLVYESAGITLNWHAPATLDQVKELQNIRQAWRCGHCGSSGTFVLVQHLEACPDCGSSLGASTRSLQYLEPAGFSVDLFAETHNDITLQEYVPVETPWITARGIWVPLINPSLGRFRSTPQGSIFHYSSGTKRLGYALCLECGRAANMGNHDDLQHGIPSIFQKPHKRLRGRQGGNDWVCGGSDGEFKIKKGISFGREYTTDVLELTLFDVDGQPLVDSKMAYTLAVALRRAIAESLGIDETELGCDSKQIRDDFNRRARVIQVFDMRSAGYCSLVASELPLLLKSARSKLICEAGCEGACQSCLLTFDTRFRSDDLDRQTALSFMTQQWIDALVLSSDDQLLGATSQAEYQPADEAITREFNRGNARKLYVYLNGDPLEWDLSGSPMRRLLHRLSAHENVELILLTSSSKLDQLSLSNASILESLQRLGDVQLRHGTGLAVPAFGQCIATIERTDGACISWATRDLACASATVSWGNLTNGLLVTALTSTPQLKSIALSLPEFGKGDSKLVKAFPVSHELDGAGAGFGQRLWAWLGGGQLDGVFPAGKAVQSIIYEDRYLATPIACALVLEVICAIKAFYEPEDGWSGVKVKIISAQLDEAKMLRTRNNWASDWETSKARDEALEAAFDYSGISASMHSRDKRDMIHGRRMSIHFKDGSVMNIWLDQGLSYWSINRIQRLTSSTIFQMNRPVAQLAEELASIKIGVEGHELPTQIFVDMQNLR